MSTADLEAGLDTRRCPNCQKVTDEILLKHTEYRCPECSFEMAHLDVAQNGAIRGVFGYLKSVGEVINDRYRIQKVLGRGGFGATYLVQDLRLNGKPRALKEVPVLLFDEHEVNVLSSLRHPAIPDIIDRFVSEAMIYLVLEFGGGQTLESCCRALGGRVPLSRALPWMHQLCDALAYLHSQNPPVIHRDLKPENILVDDRDFIMLIDFGIAKISAPSTTTRMEAAAVSHGFSPPEQVTRTGTDPRADIYSFGATFYYLLTGEIPPAANERTAGKALQPPSMFVAGLPPELDDIVLSAMRLNVNQRPGSAKDLGSMLQILDRIVAPEPWRAPNATRFGSSAARTSFGAPAISPRDSRVAAAGPTPLRPGIIWARRIKGFLLVLAATIAVVWALAAGFYYFSSHQKIPVPGKVSKQEPPTRSSLPEAPLTAGEVDDTSSSQPFADAVPSPTPYPKAPESITPGEESGKTPETASVQRGQIPRPGPAGLQQSTQPGKPSPAPVAESTASPGNREGSAGGLIKDNAGLEQVPSAREPAISTQTESNEKTGRQTKPSDTHRRTRPPPSRNF